MHVVIAGFGRVGRRLAHDLESLGHTIAVIDHDPRAFNERAHTLKGRTLVGEVFDRDTLLKAGIERADAFIAVTSGDNSNIVSARTASERFGVAHVIARINDPKRAVIYEQLGVPTVSGVHWVSARLLAMVTGADSRVDSVYGDGSVMTVEIEVTGASAGRRVAEFNRPNKFFATALVREGESRLPDVQTRLVEGDRLYVTVAQHALAELDELVATIPGSNL